MSCSQEQSKETTIKCKSCDLKFHDKKEVQLHAFIHHGKKLYNCEDCNNNFTKLYNLKRHREISCKPTFQVSRKKQKLESNYTEEISNDDGNAESADSKKYLCKLCFTSFTSKDDLHRHSRKPCRKNKNVSNTTAEKQQASTAIPTTSTQNVDSITNNSVELYNNSFSKNKEVITVETSFKNRIITYKILNKTKIRNPIEYLNSKHDIIKNLIKKELKSKPCVKINFLFDIQHANINGELMDKNFKTMNVALYQESNIDKFIKRSYKKLEREISEHQHKKSGWTVYKVHGLEVRVNKFIPLKGCSYIKLPTKIAQCKAVINVQNFDGRCFEYSVLAKLLKHKRHDPKQYMKLQHGYNFACISSPTQLKDIPKFEKINKISINIFGLGEGNKIFPMKICDNELSDHRDLLFIKNDRGDIHYCYIKNFEKLVASQIAKKRNKKIICKKCFTYYYSDKNGQERLKAHKLLCNKKESARIEMPAPEKAMIKFKNVEHSLRLPIVLFCDFECLLKKISTCQTDSNSSSTTKLQSHELLSFCVYVKSCCLNDKEKNLLPSEPYIYRKKHENDDVGAEFMRYIEKLAIIASKIYSKYDLMIPLTRQEKNEFRNAQFCYLCKKSFTPKDYKCRDHDHLTGMYRGAAHRICNLNNRKPRILPLIFHGLEMYDSHFIITKLNAAKGRIDIIPNTEEKYISFTKRILNISCRFLDSFKFMATSLAKLAKNLPREEFKETLKHNTFSRKKIRLLMRKGIYCYDYTDNLDKLNEIKLPSKENFYSILTESPVSKKDYRHAKRVWRKFKIKNLGEYSDLYLKTDVLILTDVFEHFRTLCLKTYNLDPSYYYTAPGLAWDAALKYTKIKLQLLEDYDMLLMFEEGIRGGITQCVKRHAVANNPYVPHFDPAMEIIYLCYWDSNNLYGKAMSELLPYGGFEWVDVTRVGCIEHLADEGEFGYVFEVDVIYPESLHDLHSDLPFLPEHSVLKGSNLTKLLTTLHHKKNYVAHYKFIKQAITHDLQVTKIHKGIKFLQSRWLAPYISLNTELRKLAQNEFEKDFFKLMNNSVYGKTIEQIRKRINMQLVVSEERMQILINKSSFIDRTIFAENVVAVHMAKQKLYMNKPIYVGMCILDISKIVMYEFYYEILKKRYGNKITLLYLDTDAYFIAVKTPDIYEDMKELNEHLDLSDYPADHKCYSVLNKKVLGRFKDETNGMPITRYCGLRPKMYCYEVNDTTIKKIKGVKSYAVKMKVNMEAFEKCLTTKAISHVSFRNITSKHHSVSTVECNKIALSPHDDKRVILQDGISTLPYGHKDLKYLLHVEDEDLDTE